MGAYMIHGRSKGVKMREYNMFKVFIGAVLWLMFSGFIGWLTWNFVGIALFFAGVIYGYTKRDWFLK